MRGDRQRITLVLLTMVECALFDPLQNSDIFIEIKAIERSADEKSGGL